MFSDNLLFIGPLYKFSSADNYINSLKEDPPGKMKYEIIRAFEDDNSACVIYQFSKKDISIPMAQLFEVDNHKISKIILIFDSKAFA